MDAAVAQGNLTESMVSDIWLAIYVFTALPRGIIRLPCEHQPYSWTSGEKYPRDKLSWSLEHSTRKLHGQAGGVGIENSIGASSARPLPVSLYTSREPHNPTWTSCKKRSPRLMPWIDQPAWRLNDSFYQDDGPGAWIRKRALEACPIQAESRIICKSVFLALFSPNASPTASHSNPSSAKNYSADGGKGRRFEAVFLNVMLVFGI